MADALVWHLIRDNNSFLVKRGRTRRDGAVQLSAEPGNLLNVNTFKYSGIANSRTLTLSTDTTVVNDTSDYVIALKKKSPKDFNKPSKSTESSIIADVAALNAATASYRSDLASAARARYNKVFKDIQIKKGIVKRSTAKKGRK